MSSEEVQALRRDFNNLRDEVHAWGGKIEVIHKAVLGMASKTYVPGRSIWSRIGSWFGLI